MNFDQIDALIQTHGLHHGGMHDFAAAVAEAARAELLATVAQALRVPRENCAQFLEANSDDLDAAMECNRARSKRNTLVKIIDTIGHQLPRAEMDQFFVDCGGEP